MNDQTLLLRQAHPSFVQSGRITSQVFTPKLSECNRLSVYDGDKIAVESAWRHYTSELGLKSAGVVAVTVFECLEEDLQPFPDPSDFPEHAVIEFGTMSRRRIRTVAKRLRVAADERGWLHRGEEAT